MVDESLIAYLKNKLSSFQGGVPEGGGGFEHITAEGGANSQNQLSESEKISTTSLI